MTTPERIVLVCGNRDWTCAETIRAWLSRIPKGTTILHGDAAGADRIAGAVARELGLDVLAIPADWNKHGKSAGPIRNEEMAAMSPRRGLAFGSLTRLKHTSAMPIPTGTGDMVARLLSRGIAVTIIPKPGALP